MASRSIHKDLIPYVIRIVHKEIVSGQVIDFDSLLARLNNMDFTTMTGISKYRLSLVREGKSTFKDIEKEKIMKAFNLTSDQVNKLLFT